MQQLSRASHVIQGKVELDSLSSLSTLSITKCNNFLSLTK